MDKVYSWNVSYVSEDYVLDSLRYVMANIGQAYNSMPTYIYPDGSMSHNKPVNGDTYAVPDPSYSGGWAMWAWSDSKGQWINITNNSANLRIPANLAAYINVDIGSSGKSYKELVEAKKTKCECGSEKIGSNRHSDYCPKHEN